MLEFPTMAERVLEEWRGQEKTISLAVFCRIRGAERIVSWAHVPYRQVIEYVFDDDTSICVIGRGCSHSVWAELP